MGYQISKNQNHCKSSDDPRKITGTKNICLWTGVKVELKNQHYNTRFGTKNVFFEEHPLIWLKPEYNNTTTPKYIKGWNCSFLVTLHKEETLMRLQS